jgi:hypothetical protein
LEKGNRPTGRSQLKATAYVDWQPTTAAGLKGHAGRGARASPVANSTNASPCRRLDSARARVVTTLTTAWWHAHRWHPGDPCMTSSSPQEPEWQGRLAGQDYWDGDTPVRWGGVRWLGLTGSVAANDVDRRGGIQESDWPSEKLH